MTSFNVSLTMDSDMPKPTHRFQLPLGTITSSTGLDYEIVVDTPKNKLIKDSQYRFLNAGKNQIKYLTAQARMLAKLEARKK